MKRPIALVLTAVFAVSLFAGCKKETLVEESTTASSESSAEATATTFDPAEIPSFEEYYGPQLPNYLNHQYYFDGEAVPTNITNFYFINAFETLSSYAYYGYYDATITGRIDLAAEGPLGSDFATQGDLFVSEAEYNIEYDLIMAKRAKEEGIELPDDTKQSVNEMMDSINADAAAYGLTFEQYIAHFYGPGLNEEAFREILDVYYLAAHYASAYYDKYAEERSDVTVPTVRYALFYAPETSEQSWRDEAKANADAMKEAATSLDKLTELSEEAYGAGSIYDYGDYGVFNKEDVPAEFAVDPVFEAWAFGEDRQEGEIDVIYSPDFGYFVVGYLGYQNPEATQFQEIASYVLKNSLNEEIESKIHDFHTDSEYAPSPAGPTATPIPTAAPTTAEDQSTLPSLSTDPAGTGTTPAATNQKVDSVTVLVIVFITLACVAVLAVIVILIIYAMNNYKKENAIKADIAKTKRKESDDEDEDDSEDDSDSEKKSESSEDDEEPEEETEDESDEEEDTEDKDEEDSDESDEEDEDSEDSDEDKE